MYKIIGKNVRCHPLEHSMEGFVEVKTLLVAGDFDDYAAYSGSGSDQWVAAHGNKICFEEAQVHFCNGLERDRYRA